MSQVCDAPYFTVLIPAYNEQEGIAATIASVSRELTSLSVDYEILVVDDGSRDQTSTIVEQLVSADARIRLVRHSQNMGIGAGIKTGIAEARGRFLIFVPADLAMDVKQIYRYVDASARTDIVLGNRTNWCDYTVLRRLVSVSNTRLLKFLFGLSQHQFAYINLYRVSILRKIRIEAHGVFISHELIIKARDLGARIEEVKIDYLPRQTGRAMGDKWPTVVQAAAETWFFWLKWMYRTVTRQRSRGYVNG